MVNTNEIKVLVPSQVIAQLCTRYIDEVLHQQIAAGCKQIVTLGAECPVQAISLPLANVAFFKVDLTAISWIEVLQAQGFDVHLPTHLIWQGSVPCLKRSDIIAVLDTLRDQLSQFQLSFDYVSHQLIVQALDDPELEGAVQQVQQGGVNWTNGFKDITLFTRALGLSMVETHSLEKLHDRYSPQLPLPSRLLQFYRVCTIEQNVGFPRKSLLFNCP